MDLFLRDDLRGLILFRLKWCLLSIRIEVKRKIESTTPARLFVFCTSDDFVVWPPLLQKEGKLLFPKLFRLSVMHPAPGDPYLALYYSRLLQKLTSLIRCSLFSILIRFSLIKAFISLAFSGYRLINCFSVKKLDISLFLRIQ